MPKIALVVLDTLRKNTFDDHFSWLPGIRYDNAWSTSHWTVPAHASLFTGKYPTEVGVHARRTHLNCNSPTVAEQLSQDGYKTVGLSANVHITEHYNFDRGFDVLEKCRFAESSSGAFPWGEHTSDSSLPKPIAALTGVGRAITRDYELSNSFRNLWDVLKRNYPNLLGAEKTSTSYAIEFLEQEDFPSDTFLFLNLMEMHAPYVHPPEYSSQNYSPTDLSMPTSATYRSEVGPETDYDSQRSAYTDTAKYLSDQYKKIFNILSDFDCVITLSDHGEMFGESGVLGHSYGVYPELVHVPLVVSNTSDEFVKTDLPVNLQHVYRSVLEIAGRSTDGPTLSAPGSDPVRTEYHGIKYKETIETLRNSGMDEKELSEVDTPLYGVSKSESYIYETRCGVKMQGNGNQEQLKLHLKRIKKSIPELLRDSPTDIGVDIRDNLEQLGYL